MQKFGLVLGGGGTKGAYHVGVWRALCDMKIEICAVCGTSIGSINAAVIAQGNADEGFKLWDGISMDDVVKTSQLGEVGENLFDFKNLGTVFENVYKNDGLETEPLRKLIGSIVNEDKMRASNILYGLVTFSLDKKEGVELFLGDIPKGKLIDYIMASAAMPGLKKTVIGDKKYVDGAFADNLPAGMLIRRGITDIITVDVGGVGIVKDVPKTGINHINIKCSQNVVGMLDFDAKNIKKAVKLGYYDCLKAFSRTCGRFYSFNISDYHNALIKYSGEIILGLELAAKIYCIDMYKIYKVNSLVDAVVESFKKMTENTKNPIDVQSFLIEIQKLNEKQILTKITENILNGKLDATAVKIFSGLAKEQVVAANSIAYFIKVKESV